MTHGPAADLQERSNGGRVLAFDSLRGLAAFTVIWTHFRAAFHEGKPEWYLRPLFAGQAAVVLFFVLSGYVLSMAYWRSRQDAYAIFLIRRFFRIYIPYAAAIVVALSVARPLLFAQLTLTPWFYTVWHTPLTPKMIAGQFLTLRSGELNTAFWSLRYELEMSLLIPVFCWLVARVGLVAITLVCLLLSLFGLYMEYLLHQQAVRELGLTLFCMSCFLLGTLLCQQRELITTLYKGSWPTGRLLFATAVALCFYSDLEALLPFAAGGAIILAENSWCRAWLETSTPEYLGRISYSMYLIHGTVLFANCHSSLWTGGIPCYRVHLPSTNPGSLSSVLRLHRGARHAVRKSAYRKPRRET